MNLLFIGGSNTLLRSGYVHTLLDCAESVYGIELGRVQNLAVGGNNSIHGLEILKAIEENIHEFDLVFIEYLINDIRSGPPYQCWAAGYESIIRFILARRPDIRIVSLLFSPRIEQTDKRKVVLFRHVKELSDFYSIECVDVDAYLRRMIRTPEGQPELDFLNEAYVDSAHYRRPVVSTLVGNYIANNVFGKPSSRRPLLVLGSRLNPYTFEDTQLFNFSSTGDPEHTVVEFKNSKFQHPCLKISPFKETSVLIPGGLLSLTHISFKDCGSLLVQEDGETPFYIDTLHHQVKTGKYQFLIRSFVLGWKDWNKPGCREPRYLRFKLLEKGEGKNVKYHPKMNMVPAPSAAPYHTAAAYISVGLCVQHSKE